MSVDRPVPFPGTEEEKRENLESHRWWMLPDGETVCAVCESKPWHAAAFYPCGASVPREAVECPPADLHPGMRWWAAG